MELRSYVASLDGHGLLKRVSRSVDWKYEIGEVSRGEKDKAFLFENILDYPGYRLFTGGLSSIKLMALSLGFDLDISRRAFISKLRARIRDSIEPEYSLREDEREVWRDGRVNLYDLPVPWWSRTDGGRYIGTWHINVSKSPLYGKRNIGVYRMQVIGRNQTTVSVSPRSHLALHVAEAEGMGRDLELAVAIGVAEPVVMAAAAGVRYGTDEYGLAGAIAGKPVVLLRCQTVDLEVPEGSEFILEGHIKKTIRVQDGPYLDYSGIPSVNRNAFLFEVKTVSIRKNPLFRGMSVGNPGAEDHQLFSVLSSLGLTDFHGSSLRQLIQKFCLRNRLFKVFQLSGRVGLLKEIFKPGGSR
ncbi:MAG: UbiD family decarboxylase [Fibrobacter sp.]|nr:UbiD family decarboxylase [Fibrobacter sp.]